MLTVKLSGSTHNFAFFPHISLSSNYIKTYELLFYLFPILIELNRVVSSWASVLFSNLLLKNHWIYMYFFCIIVLFYQQIITSCLGCDKLGISMFTHIFHSFFKNCIIHRFEKSFGMV